LKHHSCTKKWRRQTNLLSMNIFSQLIMSELIAAIL
jgi:hypothetical protein